MDSSRNYVSVMLLREEKVSSITREKGGIITGNIAINHPCVFDFGSIENNHGFID